MRKLKSVGYSYDLRYNICNKMVKEIFIIMVCLIFLFTVDITAEVDGNVKAFLKNLEETVYKMDTYRFTVVSENWKGRKHEKRFSSSSLKNQIL